MTDPRPLVGISADSILIREEVPASGVYDYYVRAVVEGAGGLPWVIPPAGPAMDLDALVGHLDGLVLTGAISNVEPRHYGGPPSYEGCAHDPARDATTLALIPRVLAAGVPLLGICRGFQEINVALGGSLHQEVHRIAGLDDHRAAEDADLPGKFAPAHGVAIEPGGMLAGLIAPGEQVVNSVHGQGVDRLAPGLSVEAVAPDGLIEAVSVAHARAFALAVQWHPEWAFETHPLYAAIWRAFGEACTDFAAARGRRETARG